MSLLLDSNSLTLPKTAFSQDLIATEFPSIMLISPKYKSLSFALDGFIKKMRLIIMFSPNSSLALVMHKEAISEKAIIYFFLTLMSS